MYPYDNQPPQISALANRFNPQPMNTQQDGSAPLVRQGPPTTSGQIQPAGLQPQPNSTMRPQVAALAQQYNPQFNPSPLSFGPGVANQGQAANIAQMGNGAQMPIDYASSFGRMMEPQQAALAQYIMQMQQGGASFQMPGNAQPAYNPGFTQAGQAQNNFLTTPTNPQPMTYNAMPSGNPGPLTATAQPPMGAPQQPGVQTHPMRGMGGGVGMGQPYGGGVGGLARYYTR